MIHALSLLSETATVTAPAKQLRIVRVAPKWRILRPPAGDDGIYVSIVRGPDGAMWLTDSRGRLVRVDASGTRTALSLHFSSSGATHTFLPAYAAVGSDGAFYMTGCVDVPSACSFIGVADNTGLRNVYPIPSGSSARFGGIAAGPDGNVWFSDAANVAKITPAGKVTEYPYPSGEATNELSGIAVGSDGKLWFTEVDKILIGSIDPSSGVIAEYSPPSHGINCGLSGMAAGPDGNLYVACSGGFLQVTTSGSMYYYQSLINLSTGAQEIANGSGSLLWCQFLNAAATFDPSQNLLVVYPAPGGALTLYGSASAADTRQWILAENGTVYVAPSQGDAAPTGTK